MGRFNINIDFEKSKGSYVYDRNTETLYLDMLGQFSSLAIGYNHKALTSKAFKDEITRAAMIKTAMCEYQSPERQEFIELFKEFAVPPGYKHQHFTCTGALAMEAAIKTSWARTTKTKIAVLENSFHGINSYGSFTTSRQEWMGGRLDGIPEADWVHRSHSIGALIAYLNNNEVAAVLLEPIQATYGDKYLDKDNLAALQYACNTKDILLICDEIQTGFGTTGSVWYSEQVRLKPDIIVFGKKSQVSGILANKKCSPIFEDDWKLQVTFDGDLLDMIRCKYIMRTIMDNNLMLNIITVGKAIRDGISGIAAISNVRGTGGLIAFDFETPQERDSFIKKCFKNGLLVNTAGAKSIRLRPHLAVTQEEAEAVVEIIKKVLN